MSVPRWLVLGGATLVVLSLVPLALIARARTSTSVRPRIHLIQDMGSQPSSRPQEGSALFGDGRAMRPPVENSVAQGGLDADERYQQGRAGEAWVTEIPVPVDHALLVRGRERFGVFCSPCHGLAGYGDGMIAKRAESLAEGTWVPPPSFHNDVLRGREDGYLYGVVQHGVRTMPAYGPQIPVADRWAIVAYLRALQRSQNATVADVPVALREGLR